MQLLEVRNQLQTANEDAKRIEQERNRAEASLNTKISRLEEVCTSSRRDQDPIACIK